MQIYMSNRCKVDRGWESRQSNATCLFTKPWDKKKLYAYRHLFLWLFNMTFTLCVLTLTVIAYICSCIAAPFICISKGHKCIKFKRFESFYEESLKVHESTSNFASQCLHTLSAEWLSTGGGGLLINFQLPSVISVSHFVSGWTLAVSGRVCMHTQKQKRSSGSEWNITKYTNRRGWWCTLWGQSLGIWLWVTSRHVVSYCVIVCVV